MSATLTIAEPNSLPALVDRAAATLSGARNSAEVLEARDMASLAYDAAKRAARLQKARNAHDTLIAATNRAQADALEIEAQAKRRLADEYDAAQERGELRAANERTTSKAEAVGVADIGLTHKQVHEARILRDAEKSNPGIIGRTLKAALDAGEEPTRAKVRRAALQASGHIPPERPQRGKAAVCARVRDAINLLSGLPPAAEVALYLADTDDGLLVSERLPPVLEWITELHQHMEISNAD